MITSSLLSENLETIYDNEGRPLFAHVAEEAITFFKCKAVQVQVRLNEPRCCVEIPIWTGMNLTTPAYAKHTNKRITSACTPCLILAMMKSLDGINCIDQNKTWPTPLKYFTTVSSCSVFDCIVLCFHVLFCSSFDYSSLNSSVL